MSSSDVDKFTAAALGANILSMGKTQARKEFLPLVDSLAQGHAAIEITDHDVPVAVLLSYQNYVTLISKLAMLNPSLCKPKPSLVGSLQIMTDDLEAASAEIAEQFHLSIEQSAAALRRKHARD